MGTSSKGSKEFLENRLEQAISILENESPNWRPTDSEGCPGGIILLRQDLPTLVVPDLHGRHDYLPDLMHFNFKGKSVFELLKSEKIQIVCVGDGMHGERRVLARWKIALEEYYKGFKECPAMAEEMSENFQTMSMVMRLKIAFPQLFHFLKGNHENILDEDGNGNHPFAKFAAEGPMTKLYVEKFFGTAFLNQYDRFEKNLPLLTRGKFFLISHARPRRTYGYGEVIDYRSNPGLIDGLTWTRGQTAETGSTTKMLDEIIGDGVDQRIWISGHSAINRKYKKWENEELIEIHNPSQRVLAILDPLVEFNPEKHIVTVPSAKKADSE